MVLSSRLNKNGFINQLLADVFGQLSDVWGVKAAVGLVACSCDYIHCDWWLRSQPF
jgi:hypothetical protein